MLAERPVRDVPDVARTAVAGLLAVLGASAPLRHLVEPAFGGITIALVVASGLAVLGWSVLVPSRSLRRHQAAAIGFGALATLGSVAAFTPVALRTTGFVVVWLVVIVPGLAALARDPALRRALLLGFVAGTAVYLLVAGARLATGRPALDVVGGSTIPSFLGINRNAIDLPVLVAVPLLAARDLLGIPRVVRWAGLALAVLWLVSSEGRTALAGLVLIPCTLYAVAPRGRRPAVRAVVAVVATGLLVVVLIRVVAPDLPASDRLAQLQEGDLSGSDEQRVLLLRKAWSLGWRSPLLGIGIGSFEGRFHPVVNEASRSDVRLGALLKPAHNTYLEVFVGAGLGATVLFVAMVGAPLLALVRHRRHGEARGLAASYVVLLFGIAFHSSLGSVLYLPLAAAIGAASSWERS